MKNLEFGKGKMTEKQENTDINDVNSETTINDESSPVLNDTDHDPGDAIVDKDAAMDGNEAEPDTPESETSDEGITYAEPSISEPDLQPNVKMEIEAIDDESENVPGQPDTVTKSPQDPEHANLHGIQDVEKFSRVYVPVSDDAGERHGDIPLEAKVRAYIEQNININPDNIADKENFLTSLRELIQQYFGQINLTEGITAGIITKYRIRLGGLFNIEKKFVKSKEWEDHYNKFYDRSRRRSVQVWMQIASVPNSIHFAALGLERLLDLVRAVDGYKSDEKDPIGDFMKKNQLSTDLENVESFKDFKVEIDTVIAKKKIEDAAFQNQATFTINPKLLKKWIKKGKEVNGGLIKDLIMIKKAKGDPNQLLKDLLQNEGPTIITLTSEKTVNGFPVLVSQIKSTVEYIQKNKELIGRINDADIEMGETLMSALKAMRQNH